MRRANEKQKSDASTSTTTAEYFTTLERWLQEAYMWQCMNAWFPYMLLSQQAALQNQQGPTSVPHTHTTFTAPPPNVVRQPQQPQRNSPPPLLGVEYRVPPLWKRFAAEFLDFLILFSLKLVITLVAVDVFEFIWKAKDRRVSRVFLKQVEYVRTECCGELFVDGRSNNAAGLPRKGYGIMFCIDLDKYDLDILQSNSKMDYQMALQMTTEILVLEVVHRIVVCVFEGICLYQGSEGRIGGATPGKNTMGLRVVLCDRVITGTQPRTVLVYPASDLGLPTALWRSFVKNMVIAFFFPVCFSMFFFQHNRAAYDVLCRTIVVEDPQPQQRPLAQRR